jgi:hypothetical protein
MNLLETYSNAFTGYIVKLFNSSCNINVVRIQMHNHIQYEYEKIKILFFWQIKKLQIQWSITSQYLNNF